MNNVTKFNDSELRSILIERASEFDLHSLVNVLGRYGYQADQILFESNATQFNSASLVAGVRFSEPSGQPIITLNLGLLGASGLLPSYFMALVESQGAVGQYHDFVRFFDHWVLSSLLRVLSPEWDRALLSDWLGTKRDVMRMVGVSSRATLAWLFQTVYPELPVRVQGVSLASQDDGSGARPGSRLDGSGVLGGGYQSRGRGYAVTIVAPEESDERGRLWREEIEGRFDDQLRPVLVQQEVPVKVSVLVLQYERWLEMAVLASGSGSRLGLERVRGNEGRPHRLEVYSTAGRTRA